MTLGTLGLVIFLIVSGLSEFPALGVGRIWVAITAFVTAALLLFGGDVVVIRRGGQ